MGNFTEIKLEKATIRKITSKIIEVDYKNHVDINIEEAKQIFNTILRISNGQKFVMLLDDYNKSVNFNNQVKDFFSKGDEVIKANTAMAIILTSVGNKLIGRIFMNLHKPDYPVKLFSSRVEAINWLDQIYDSL